MELEPRGKKNERVRRYETQRLVSDFKVSGQPVTSEVRSSDPGADSFFINNFAKKMPQSRNFGIIMFASLRRVEWYTFCSAEVNLRC